MVKGFISTNSRFLGFLHAIILCHRGIYAAIQVIQQIFAAGHRPSGVGGIVGDGNFAPITSSRDVGPRVNTEWNGRDGTDGTVTAVIGLKFSAYAVKFHVHIHIAVVQGRYRQSAGRKSRLLSGCSPAHSRDGNDRCFEQFGVGLWELSRRRSPVFAAGSAEDAPEAVALSVGYHCRRQSNSESESGVSLPKTSS